MATSERPAALRSCRVQASREQTGFTLIEALIALALLALLGLASALALSSAMRAQTVLETHQQRLERLQRSQLLLRRDLEQTVVRQGRDTLGQPLNSAFIANQQADSSQPLQPLRAGRFVPFQPGRCEQESETGNSPAKQEAAVQVYP